MSLRKVNLYGESKARWYLGASSTHPKDRMVEDALEAKHSFFVASDYFKEGMNRPTKVYASYKNFKEFWNNYKNIPPENKCVYELITRYTPCRLFADLEWSLEWKSSKQIMDKMLKLLKTFFKEKLDKKFMKNEMLFLNACRKSTNKGSLHMHVPGFYFESIQDQQRFWNWIYLELEKDEEWWFIDECSKTYVLKTFIDFAVYNKDRQIRMIESSKMNSQGKTERPLRPLKGFETSPKKYIITHLSGDEHLIDVSDLPEEIKCTSRSSWSKDVLQKICDDHNLEVSVSDLSGKLVKLRNKRTTGRYCPICQEEDTSDNAYLLLKQNKVVFKCHDHDNRLKEKVLFKTDDSTKRLTLEDEIPFEFFERMYWRIEEKQSNSYERFMSWMTSVRREINRYCCVISGNTKPYVLYRSHDFEYETDIKTTNYLAKSLKNFKETFSHFTYYPIAENGTRSKTPKPIVDLWLNWSKRNTKLKEVCLSHDLIKNHTNAFNTFDGLAIGKSSVYDKISSQDDEDLEEWLSFIKTEWCGDEDELFTYVMNWFAHIVQFPGVKTDVALLMRGHQGTGKGMVVQVLGKILGSSYFYQPSSIEHVLGNFNHLIANKFLVFCDEITWGGYKKKDGELKGLITERTLTCNEKFGAMRKLYDTSNYIFASNSDWALPVDKQSRRYVCLEMGNGLLKKSREYKSRLANISPYVVARYLYNRDISTFSLRDIPITKGLQRQKLFGMHPIHMWFYELLESEDERILWGSSQPKREIYDMYKEERGPNVETPKMFWLKLKEISPFENANKSNKLPKVLIKTLGQHKNDFNNLYGPMFDND